MATWNINVEAVEGPATSTTGNIPQWADTSGDELTDGLGVVTEADGISSNDNDDTVPTCAAVKDYVDNSPGGGDVSGPGSSTDGYIPTWDGTGGDTLATGLATSEGGNGSGDSGKVALFNADGTLTGYSDGTQGVYGGSDTGQGVFGESSSGAGVYGSSVSAPGVFGESVDQVGVGASSSGPNGALHARQTTSSNDIATFENSADGTNVVIGADGTLTWSDAAGSAGTTANLDAMVGDSGSGGTKGLVPAPAAGDAAAGKFLKADGTWATAGGGSGTVTSVAVSGSDGIEVDSGSPITGSGTIALGVNAASLRTHINVEDGADVTDTASVTAAGALMDSEVTNLAAVKAFDPADYATAAQGATADSALQPGTVTAGDIDAEASTDGYVLTSDGAGNAAWEAVSGGVSDGDKGDITVSGSGSTWTINNGAVQLDDIEDIGAARFVMRNSGGGPGAPQAGGANDAATILDTATDPFIRSSVQTAKGDVMTATAAGTPAPIAVGSNGQVLTADSSQSTGLKYAYVQRLSFQVTDQGSATVWTAMPAADTFFNGVAARNVFFADLGNATQCRIVVNMGGIAGHTTAKVGVRYRLFASGYSTTLGDYSSFGASGDITADINVSNAQADSGWVNINASAKTEVSLAVYGTGGNGSASPVIQKCMIYLR